MSSLNWWQSAGVDILVDEEPRDWLAAAPIATNTIATAIASAAPVASVQAPLPKTLDDFIPWFMTSPDMPGLGAERQRIAPAGNRQADLMILLDMPEPEDAAAGQLLSGEAGALFDKMLGALGFSRDTIWFAPMVSSRVAGGAMSASDAERIAEITRHHVGLIAPKMLWLLGRAASRALLGMDEGEARGRLHIVNHISGTSKAIASVHPRVLLQTPKRKADVWSDMQKLIEK